jgi:hypothetical protein
LALWLFGIHVERRLCAPQSVVHIWISELKGSRGFSIARIYHNIPKRLPKWNWKCPRCGLAHEGRNHVKVEREVDIIWEGKEEWTGQMLFLGYWIWYRVVIGCMYLVPKSPTRIENCDASRPDSGAGRLFRSEKRCPVSLFGFGILDDAFLLL